MAATVALLTPVGRRRRRGGGLVGSARGLALRCRDRLALRRCYRDGTASHGGVVRGCCDQLWIRGRGRTGGDRRRTRRRVQVWGRPGGRRRSSVDRIAVDREDESHQ